MLITHAVLYPMDAAVIYDGFLRIEDGKIIELGTMEQLSDREGEVWDLQGRHVLPGLVDSHCHLGMFGDSVGFENEEANETTDPITPQLRALDAVNPYDRYFSEAARSGVTSVVTGPGSANPIGGQLLAMKTHGASLNDMLLKAPCAMKFALGENPKQVYHGKNAIPQTRMAVAALIRERLEKARRYEQALTRAEQNGSTLPVYDAKNEALVPLLRREIPAHFHAHRANDIETALRISEEFDLDCTIVHATEGVLLAQRLAQAEVPVIVGPIMTDRSKPELSLASEKNPAQLAAAGVTLAICTDHPEVPIPYLLLSAAIAVRGGMEPMQALRSITLTAAQLAGISDRVGSLTVGKDADFVVFERTPFDVTQMPRAVFINGCNILA